MMADCDLLIRGGTIVDGSGGEPCLGDVAISGGRIIHAGPGFVGASREAIDAAGLIVTPGFVDIHTHYDGQAIWSEEMTPSSAHGVTTVLTGNCGVGFAPCRSEDHERLIKVMEGVEDIPGVVMAEGLPWTWETFPEFLDALEARPRDIDLAAYLPHSPLRVYVMGERGARREAATPDDLAQMQVLAREALEAGAIGFASSRLVIHRTLAGDLIPSYGAADAELQAIASALGEADKGVLQMVLDLVQPDDWAEEFAHLVGAVETSGRPGTFSLGIANGGNDVWRQALDACAAARQRGVPITPQILPRPVGVIMGFALSIHPFSLCPSYEAIAALPMAEQLPYLTDPGFRKQVLSETPRDHMSLATLARKWEWIHPFGDPPDYSPPPETSVAAQARASRRSPLDVAWELMLDGGSGEGRLFNAVGNFPGGSLDALHGLLSGGECVLGLGDGGAHYSSICDASYPTFMLTYWVRDRAEPRLSLPETVHALSARPARTVGLADRGLLAPGYKADVNVIDPAALRLHAPVIRHDLPGGGRRLDQAATGYVATICGGEIIRRNDQSTGARPGRLVRGAQPAP